jgi:hypothetical protein
MVVIGIDLHKRTHTASVLEPGTHAVLGTLQIEASLAGLPAAVALGRRVRAAQLGRGEWARSGKSPRAVAGGPRRAGGRRALDGHGESP